MATKPKPEPKPKAPAVNVDDISSDVDSAITYVRDSYWPAWESYWKLYNNERNGQNVGYRGVADTFEPMTFSTVEALVANVFGSKPRLTYMPTMREQYRETKVLSQMFDAYWDANDLSSTIITFGRELFITGNSALWVSWDGKKKRPTYTHVPIRDCIFDPTAVSPHSMRFAGYRKLVDVRDLEDVMLYDAETGTSKPKYTALDKIQRWTNSDADQDDKDLKDMYRGSTLDDEAKKNQIELICMYYVSGKYKGKVIELANRGTVIYFDDSPFQRDELEKAVRVAQLDENGEPVMKPVEPPVPASVVPGQDIPAEPPKDENGEPLTEPVYQKQKMTIPEIEAFLPVVFQRCYTDGSQLLGKGEVEPMAPSQELLNDTINQKRDNITHNINNTIVVDPKYKELIPKIKNLPNAVYPVPPGAIEYIQKPDMTGTADAEIERIKQSIRETTGTDEVVRGIASPSNTTATEIQTQMAAAGQRFSVKLQMLENEGYKDLAKITFDMIRLFVTSEEVVRLAGRGGVEWLKFNPDDFWGEYEPRVQLEATAKAQRQQEVQKIEAVGSLLLGNPYINQPNLIKSLLAKMLEFDDDEVDTLMAKSPNGSFGANGGSIPGVPFHPMTKLLETIDFADLPADAQQQLLDQVGIKSEMLSPSATAQQATNVDIQDKLMKQGGIHPDQLSAQAGQEHQQGMDMLNFNKPDPQGAPQGDNQELIDAGLTDLNKDGVVNELDLALVPKPEDLGAGGEEMIPEEVRNHPDFQKQFGADGIEGTADDPKPKKRKKVRA